MALSMDGLKKLLDGENLRFFLHPNQPAVLLGVTGQNGTYQMTIAAHEQGNFLQVRTSGYLYCKPGDRYLDPVLRVVVDLGTCSRFVKFGWDPGDGEIMAYGDMWVVDGQVTQQQFNRILGNFFTVIDAGLPRLRATIETGQDPGPDAKATTKKADPNRGGPGGGGPEFPETI